MYSYGRFRSTLMPKIEMNFLLTVPDDRAPGEKLPLILGLHGAGERGNDEKKLTVHGVGKYFISDGTCRGVRAITLSPQCPEGLVWANVIVAVKELLDNTVADLDADRERVSVTGLSMGGFGTWEMICTYPHFFCAAAPVCGGGLSWRGDLLKNVPIRAYHGECDSVVPPVYSKLMVDAVNAAGGHAELKLYPGVRHNSWENAYAEPDIFDFLTGKANI
ncbi:MAG: dienelactone hydrolase family protein [Clostridia bacterium]|nr:dienelactone hydrolase family protein [Clostridia bacterium]